MEWFCVVFLWNVSVIPCCGSGVLSSGSGALCRVVVQWFTSSDINLMTSGHNETY